MRRRSNTHERPYALPIYVHRDGSEEADGLARAENEQRHLDAAGDDDAVVSEGRAVEYEVVCRADDGEDVLGVGAVRVEQIRHCRPAGGDQSEGNHATSQ